MWDKTVLVTYETSSIYNATQGFPSAYVVGLLH